MFEHESFQEAKKRIKNQNKIQIYSLLGKVWWENMRDAVIQNLITFKIPQTITKCLIPTPTKILKSKINQAI